MFTRLLGQDGGWSHVDVVRYLVSVRESLATNELERLRKTAWLPKEEEEKVPQPVGADGVAKKPRTIRWTAEQLFEVSTCSRYNIEHPSYLPSTAHRISPLSRTSSPRLDWCSAQMAIDLGRR